MSLKSQTISGVKWTTAASAVNTVVQLIQLTILVRILSPSDFGLMALGMVVIGFSQLFIDMGVSNAIIYKQDVTEEQLSSLYWINIIMGALFFVLIIMTSPLVADFYRNKELSRLINLIALTFLIKPWGQQFMILLQKDLKFDAISKTDILSRILSFITVVTLAYLDFGVYSLAFGAVMYSLVSTIGYNLNGRRLYRPRFYFDLKGIRDFISFGIFQMGDKFLNYFSSQFDTILIGRLMGMEILGVYNIAKDLTSKPYAVINPIITKVTFPMLSKITNDISKLSSVFLKSVKYLSFVNVAVYFLIAILAKPLVLIFFGSEWTRAIPLIQVLSISFIFRSIGNPAGSLVLSRGKANVAFYWNLFVFLISPVFIYLGSTWGITGVTISMLALQLFLFIPNWRFIIYPFTHIYFKSYILVISRPFALGIIAGSVSSLIVFFITDSLLEILIGGFVFCLIYALLLKRFEGKLINDLASFLPSKITSKLMCLKKNEI